MPQLFQKQSDTSIDYKILNKYYKTFDHSEDKNLNRMRLLRHNFFFSLRHRKIISSCCKQEFNRNKGYLSSHETNCEFRILQDKHDNDFNGREFESNEERVRSFEESNSKLRNFGRKFASAGFFCHDVQDKVECFSCGIILFLWKETENPYEAHVKYNNQCRFLKQTFADDVPLRGQPIDLVEHKENDSNFESPSLILYSKEPVYPEKRIYRLRKDSLILVRHFDENLSLKYAACGFFLADFEGKYYHLCCFCCGFTVKLTKTLDLNESKLGKHPYSLHEIYSSCSHFQSKVLDREELITLKPTEKPAGEPIKANTLTLPKNLEPRSTRSRLDHPLIQIFLQKDYDRTTVARALELHLKAGLDICDFAEFRQRVERLLALEEDQKNLSTVTQNNSDSDKTLSLSDANSLSEYRTFLKDIKEKMMCRNRLKECKNESNTVCLPCGCLSICDNCVIDLIFCPMCSCKIRTSMILETCN